MAPARVASSRRHGRRIGATDTPSKDRQPGSRQRHHAAFRVVPTVACGRHHHVCPLLAVAPPERRCNPPGAPVGSCWQKNIQPPLSPGTITDGPTWTPLPAVGNRHPRCRLFACTGEHGMMPMAVARTWPSAIRPARSRAIQPPRSLSISAFIRASYEKHQSPPGRA